MKHLRGHWEPGRLLSLLDVMRKINLKEFLQLGMQIEDAFATLGLRESDQSVPSDTELKLTDDVIRKLIIVCDNMGFPELSGQLDFIKDNPPPSSRDFQPVWRALSKGLEGRLIMYVSPDRAVHYNKSDYLSVTGRVAFPQANQELITSGKLEDSPSSPSASVFHSMRALEHGLGAFAADAGVRFEEKNEGPIIDEIASKYSAIEKALPRGHDKSSQATVSVRGHCGIQIL